LAFKPDKMTAKRSAFCKQLALFEFGYLVTFA